MENLINIEEVQKLTGLGRTTIYQYIKAGKFPSQVKLSYRNSVWIAREVYCWIDNKISERNLKEEENM